MTIVRDLGPFILGYILLSNLLKMRRYEDISPMSCSVTVWDSGRNVTILDCEIAPLFGRKGTERGGGVRNGSKNSFSSCISERRPDSDIYLQLCPEVPSLFAIEHFNLSHGDRLLKTD